MLPQHAAKDKGLALHMYAVRLQVKVLESGQSEPVIGQLTC